MSQTPACPDVPASIAGDPLLTMLWHAVRFSNWAAGEGQCPNEDQGVRAPDEFLFDFSKATDEEDWETLADRLPQLLADRASRALPSTALAARPEEGWQPIETALKDGSDLVCLAPEYNGHVILFWWAEHGSWFDHDGDRYNPTHWHPLAPYPSTPPTAGDGHD